MHVRNHWHLNKLIILSDSRDAAIFSDWYLNARQARPGSLCHARRVVLTARFIAR